MPHSARPLRITIASPDSAVLHELSWMLSAVGYMVATSKDISENAAWRHFADTDFVLFDARSITHPKNTTLTIHSQNPIYWIFLYGPESTGDLTAWFVAGANDGLRVPVSRGELLARIRAGARVVEFESRLQSRSNRNQLPGIYSIRGMLRRLNKFTIEGKSLTLGHTLLTIAIDFFSGFCRTKGALAGQELLTALANSLQQSTAGDVIAAYHDDGVFQVLLPGQRLASARGIAEHIAQKFRAIQAGHEPSCRMSLTTAIVPWQVGVHPDQLLERGLETLVTAKQSGGDCIVEQHEFQQEMLNWRQELNAGSPFANVIAQDIMEPFPAILEHDTPDQAMLAALHQSGAPAWPFVDLEGHLVGVAASKLATSSEIWGPTHQQNQDLINPITIAHNATFSEIYETFSTQGCLILVVVAERRPIGYLTCQGFLSLIEPINSATFSSHEAIQDDSQSLLVGSLVNGFEPELGYDQ